MKKSVTIYTIAKELNMTPTSVSRAFNPNAKITEKKREIILKTAKKYNFVPNRAAARLSRPEIVIGIMVYADFKPFYKQVIEGIVESYETLKSYKLKCDIRLKIKNRTPRSECYRILDEFIDRGYDGIIVCGLTAYVDRKVLSYIAEKNPNLTILQDDFKEVNRLFSVAPHSDISSRMAAELLACCLKHSERKNVILFTGELESMLQRRSKVAFIKAAEEFGLCLLDTLIMEEEIAPHKAIALDMLDKYKDRVDGIYITVGKSIELCEAIEDNGLQDKITLITFDVYPEIVEYIRRGVVTATINQNIRQQSGDAIKHMFFYILDGEKPPDSIYSNLEFVMKSNLSMYT